jgi:cobalt-zinc-cadmium efflux system membrane fusion protein
MNQVASQPMPRGRQIAILVAVALGAAALWGVVTLVGLLTAPKPVAVVAPPPGTFRPTPEQWGNLSFAEIRDRDFAAASVTDGQVATNDDHTTQVFSPLTGRVITAIAKAGDTVRAGSPLFTVQATEFVQGQADLVTAVAQLRVAKAVAARQEALLKVEGAAVKDVQQAQADLANAREGLEAAREKLRILGKSNAEIAELEQEADGKTMKGVATVSSPIAGVVTQRAVGVGQNVASLSNGGGGSPAYVVSDLRTVWLVANVREDDAGVLHRGAQIIARVPALPGRVFRGRINFVSPSVDPNTRRIAVRAEIANPDLALRPQMFADMTVSTGAAAVAPAAPEQAVVYEGDTARVWVARPDKTLELRNITTGRTQGGYVEVIKGLSTGERVVTVGAVFIDRASTSD